MTAALAVRDACQRQVDKSRSIDHLNIDTIVRHALSDAATCMPCPDEVFDGMASAIQAQSHCTATQAFEQVLQLVNPSVPLHYSRWRHGGWYVSGIRYPSGACGCVSSNYPDRKWRIVCDDRRQALNDPGDVTFGSREAAARAEQVLVLQTWEALVRATTERGVGAAS
ncbi:hypothetical protein [Acidovorax delafieldii]|nr:hypothetical protein [Acidovorax delafieldii]